MDLPPGREWCDASGVRTLVLAVATLSLVASGCRASASASINTGKKQKEESFDEAPQPLEQNEADPLAGEYALLGARQDLRLSPDKKTPTCSCLAVALGPPNDAAFKWDGPVPTTDPETQLVVALSSEGVGCPEAKPDAIGASYWGYRQSGDDIIVIVESAKLGRPLTAGAIIPKPVGAGQVYLRPAAKGVPYGKPLVAGDKICKLGNPGPVRSTAPAPEPTDEQNQP